MSWKSIRKQIKRSSKFALNPAKGTRELAQEKPKYAPIIGKAAGLFTLGIGEKVAVKGFQSDIKKGRVAGMGPNMIAPDIDTSTPLSITPGEPVLGERAQVTGMSRSPRSRQPTRAQLAQAQPTRTVLRARGQTGYRRSGTVGNAFKRRLR